jgi:beta-N-acetylhexosaminidase
MNAIKEFYGVSRGCTASLSAGVDMVFVCHDPALMEESLRAAAAAYGQGRFDPAEFDASVEKILAYRERYAAGGLPRSPALPEAAGENAALMRRTIARLDGDGRPLALGPAPLFVGCLPYRSTIASSKADGSLSFAPWFAGRLGGRALENSLDPGDEEIRRILAQVSGASALVLGTFNGHLNRGQLALGRALFEAARQEGIPFAAAALRNPYDLLEIPAGACRLAAWEYSLNSFAALEEVFQGRLIPRGSLDCLPR